MLTRSLTVFAVFAVLLLMSTPLGATTIPIELGSASSLGGLPFHDLAFTIRTENGAFEWIWGASSFPGPDIYDQMTAGFLSQSILVKGFNGVTPAENMFMRFDLVFDPFEMIPPPISLPERHLYPGSTEVRQFSMTGTLTAPTFEQDFYGQGLITVHQFPWGHQNFGFPSVSADFVFVPEPPAVLLLGISLAALAGMALNRAKSPKREIFGRQRN